MFYLNLPYEVEKKFYTLGTHDLSEAKAPVLQSEGTIGWLATFLKKKHVEEKQAGRKDAEAVRKGAELLKRFAAMNTGNCKFLGIPLLCSYPPSFRLTCFEERQSQYCFYCCRRCF
jgi:hypothetical protein